MTSADLLSAIHTEPFVPFRLRLVSGYAVLVDRPERIKHASGRPSAFVITPDGSLVKVRLVSVVSLEFGPVGTKFRGYNPPESQ